MLSGDWNINAQMVIQVHDEINWLIRKSEEERIVPIINEEMENAIKLRVPLVVDYKGGENWNECK